MAEKADASDVPEERESACEENDETPSSSVSEVDVSNMLQRLESRETRTRIINVEDRIIDPSGNIVQYASHALASQIKKIAPSLNIVDKLVEAAKEPSVISLASKSSSSSIAQPAKTVQFDPVKKLSIISEVEYDDTDKLDEQSTAEVIDETIKKIPVCMNRKRQRRNTLMILPKKTPWYTKLLNKLYRFSATLYKYQLWHEHLRTIEGRFGASVVSYFLFIRWLLLMNSIILLLNFIFLVLPQYSLSRPEYPNNSFKETFNHSKYLNWTVDNLEGEEFAEINHENIYTIEDIFTSNTVARSLLSEPVNSNSSDLMKIVAYCHKRYRAEYRKMKYSGFLAKIQSILDGRVKNFVISLTQF